MCWLRFPSFHSFSNTPMELIFASMRYGYAEIMHTELLMFVDYDFLPPFFNTRCSWSLHSCHGCHTEITVTELLMPVGVRFLSFSLIPCSLIRLHIADDDCIHAALWMNDEKSRDEQELNSQMIKWFNFSASYESFEMWNVKCVCVTTWLHSTSELWGYWRLIRSHPSLFISPFLALPSSWNHLEYRSSALGCGACGLEVNEKRVSTVQPWARDVMEGGGGGGGTRWMLIMVWYLLGNRGRMLIFLEGKERKEEGWDGMRWWKRISGGVWLRPGCWVEGCWIGVIVMGRSVWGGREWNGRCVVAS